MSPIVLSIDIVAFMHLRLQWPLAEKYDLVRHWTTKPKEGDWKMTSIFNKENPYILHTLYCRQPTYSMCHGYIYSYLHCKQKYAYNAHKTTNIQPYICNIFLKNRLNNCYPLKSWALDRSNCSRSTGCIWVACKI